MLPFSATNLKCTHTHTVCIVWYELMRQRPNNLIINVNMMQKYYARSNQTHMEKSDKWTYVKNINKMGKMVYLQKNAVSTQTIHKVSFIQLANCYNHKCGIFCSLSYRTLFSHSLMCFFRFSSKFRLCLYTKSNRNACFISTLWPLQPAACCNTHVLCRWWWCNKIIQLCS